MVKGQRKLAFCTIPDICMELQGYLDEGLFTNAKDSSTVIGDYGTGINAYVPVTPSKVLEAGIPVKRVAGENRTFEKSDDSNFDAVILTDPEGFVPLADGDTKREALLQFPQMNFNYHIPLPDDNPEIQANDIIIWDGSKWDKSTSVVAGYNFVSVEDAPANSGKYIDCYLKYYQLP